jgi:hypothetical protein
LQDKGLPPKGGKQVAQHPAVPGVNEISVGGKKNKLVAYQASRKRNIAKEWLQSLHN